MASHEKVAVGEGHGAPVFQVATFIEIGLEDVGFGEKFEAGGIGVNEAEDATFAILNDDHAIGKDAVAPTHEGLVAGVPEFFSFESVASQPAGLALGLDLVVGVLVGEEVKVVVDEKRRVNLGPFLDLPEGLDLIFTPLLLN